MVSSDTPLLTPGHDTNPYIYGKLTQVETDHKPLESIMKNPLGIALPRLQRMMLQLQRYELEVHYKPGKDVPVADALSRAQLPGTEEADENLAADMEVMDHALGTSLPMSVTRREEIQRATSQDPELQALLRIIRSGWPTSIAEVQQAARPFWTVRDELHEAEGQIFKCNKIIIHTALRPEMLRIIHEGHQGEERCKGRARMVMYWPNMTRSIDEVVRKCPACLRHGRSKTKEPLIQHGIPERPWQKLAADIMTLQGKDFLLVVD